MRAIILAAGIGRRMRPLTDTIPKGLIEIAGQPIIGGIIDALLANGVDKIMVITGYRAAELEGWLRQNYSAVDLQFVRNERYEDTNNVVSMALAFEHLPVDDDVLVIESDLVCEPAVFERIIRSPHRDVALVDRWRTGMDGTVVTVNDGIVTSIIPPHLQAGDFSFADKYKTLNIYKFSEEFCRGSFKELLEYYVQTIDRHSYYEVILGILIYVQKAVIQAEILDGERWAEVDDPNDLRLAEFNFNGPERRRILEESLGGYWSFGEVLDFCFIRNMYFPTPAMMAEIRNTLPQLINNYGSTQQVLNRKLSLALLCEPHRVNVLNGVSQMYPFLGARFGNRKALIPDPSFREYDRTFPNHDCYDDRVGVDTSEIETLAAHADVVVFVNPNNPTGTTISTEWIFRFAQMRPECLVIVDESFIAFAAEPSIVSMLETRALPNVLVLTSLSKSWGVPGVRLGYAYTCDGSLCEDIAAWLPIWNLNSVAEYLLEIVLKHRDSLAASMEATITDREAFMTELKVTPCVETVYPSGGNFLLVTLRPGVESGAEIVDRLLERESVYVKNVSNRLGDGRVHLRVAVRQPHENRFFCAALHRSSAADEFEYRQ